MHESRAHARRINQHNTQVEKVRASADRDACDVKPVVRILRFVNMAFEYAGNLVCGGRHDRSTATVERDPDPGRIACFDKRRYSRDGRDASRQQRRAEKRI